jgi:hypothetical protein
MSNKTHHAHQSGNGGFERRDIGVSGVVYFLAGLAMFGVITHFVVTGLYRYLENQTEAQQTPVSPLVTNAAKDTRHLPPEYNGDYDKYLQKNFPSPQLEIDERNQLDKIRLQESQTLSTYDWINQNAGTVRIPIERAMDLIAQRGLPVRAQAAAGEAPVGMQSKSTTKGTRQ